MNIPTIQGTIDRRILINFAVDLNLAKRIVPSPFVPKAVNGKAIAGICLIRLKNIRPKGLPAFMGIGSENGAHRIAVEWMEDGRLKEGVYIPRRDTSSTFNTIAGGRIFPGKHFHAKFDVVEKEDAYQVAFHSSDGEFIDIQAKVTNALNPKSIFKNIGTASEFFKNGSLGYSPNGLKYEGLLLNTHKWEVKPLEVSHVRSSFFENEAMFPKGTVVFDNALLMVNIPHEWSAVKNKFVKLS